MLKNNELEFRRRTKELIAKLTLDEKLMMLTTGHGAVERLGLDEYHIGAEVARGFVGRSADRVSTVFPQPVGLASTFDRDLMYKLGVIAADEARAYYNLDKRRDIALWGPTVDMARDPRWGRNEEAYGEDVCLTGELSKAYTTGMVGDNGKYVKSIPSLKHFCANNNEEGRGSCDAYLPLRLKYDYYYAAFENSIVNGGAKSLMTAYNEINGCPAVLNPELKTIIKGKWGLWYTVTDGGDYSQTVNSHRFCKTHSESLALSLKAGSDSMTDDRVFVAKAAKIALEEGLLTEADIDETLANTLFSRFALGQFDDDCEYNNIGLDVIDCDEHKATNLRAAREQITLLKNNGILPLKTKPNRIAVLGALADENLMDWYTGVSSYDISVLQGVKDEYPDAEVVYDTLWDHVSIKAPNGKYLSVDENGLVSASADSVGESEIFELQDWGENWINFFSVKYGKYVKLTDDKLKLNNRRIYDWYTRETFNLKKFGDKYLIEEFLHHRRLFCDDNGDIGVVNCNNALNDQLFEISVVESGKSRGANIADYADVVIYCVGNYPVQVAKECYDRTTLELNIQSGMATHLKSVNPDTIMVIVSSYPYAINKEAKLMPAIIYTSHAGMFLGTAVAETVSGKNNPAGRTPQTWYKSEHELPDILNYDIESAGTTYMYFKGEPIYPFGYGLSYSSFEYDGFDVVKEGNDYFAKVTVKNVSSVDGDEVVQVYYTVLDSEIVRPIKKLCGFERVNIKAGEAKEICVPIHKRMLEAYSMRNGENILEDADYKFMCGASSADIRCEKVIHVDGTDFGIRGSEFLAETYDSCKEMRIRYSKDCGHYIRGTGWSPIARYEGINFAGKKTLTVYAATTAGRGRMTVDFGEAGRVDINIDSSDHVDAFKPYTIDIPDADNIKAMNIYAGESVSILKFVAE